MPAPLDHNVVKTKRRTVNDPYGQLIIKSSAQKMTWHSSNGPSTASMISLNSNANELLCLTYLWFELDAAGDKQTSDHMLSAM